MTTVHRPWEESTMSEIVQEKDEKQKRGFALFTPERRAEVARKGALEAHRRGTARRWTREEARAAGRLGGAAAHKNKKK
jgi:general stress protein YciG